MIINNNREAELDYRAYDSASELWHAWEDYYSEWFTFDEYVERIMVYLKNNFDIIKADIDNADDEE